MLSFGFILAMVGIFFIMAGFGIKMYGLEDDKPEPIDHWEEPLQKGAGRE